MDIFDSGSSFPFIPVVGVIIALLIGEWIRFLARRKWELPEEVSKLPFLAVFAIFCLGGFILLWLYTTSDRLQTIERFATWCGLSLLICALLFGRLKFMLYHYVTDTHVIII